MSDLNIDDFYKDAARAIVALYNVFPRPVPIYVEDISGPDDPDEYGVHSHRHQACFATLVWLGEEGFVRYVDTIKQEAIDQAVLTRRCFAALLKPTEHPLEDDLPQSVQVERQTHIYRLAQAVNEKSSITIREALLPLLTHMAN